MGHPTAEDLMADIHMDDALSEGPLEPETLKRYLLDTLEILSRVEKQLKRGK